MTDKDIAAELQEQFGGSNEEVAAQGNKVIPAGKCVLQITETYLEKSKTQGRKQFVAICEVLEHEDPKSIGGKYWKAWGLETAQSLGWLVGDLSNLEFPLPTKTAELIAAVIKLDNTQALAGVIFQATLSANKDAKYPPNCFIAAGARRPDLEQGKVSTPKKTNF